MFCKIFTFIFAFLKLVFIKPKAIKDSIIVLAILFPVLAFSQQVENIHFEQSGKQIHIYYDLQGEGTYNVRVYCSTDEGRTWGQPLQKVTGAVGKNQKPGRNKEIVWDVLSERDDLVGRIVFKIEARRTEKTYKSSFLPVCIPGARINYYPGGKDRGAIKAVAFYGMAGSAVLFKLMSDKQYKLYHEATEQEDMDKYYNQANGYYMTSQASLVIGITVWALDMLIYGAKGFKPVNNKIVMKYDPATKSMNLAYIHKF
jgi:hypothetical protein